MNSTKIKNLVQRALPRPMIQIVKAYRSVARNAKAEQRLLDIQAPLPQDHLQNVTLLSTRMEMLDVLPKSAVVAEVGVAEGDFSKQIINRCHPQKLHLIDYWDFNSDRYGKRAYNSVISKVGREIDSQKVVLNRGISWDVLKEFPDDYFDWVYLDAGHDYESIYKDLEIARHKVKPNGLIGGHDYTKWSNSGLKRYGVVEAVNSFCIKYNWELKYLTNETDRHLSYMIQRRVQCSSESA